VKVLDAETALEFLEVEMERLWAEANVAAVKAGEESTAGGQSVELIRKEISLLNRGGVIYECLELVRTAKRKI